MKRIILVYGSIAGVIVGGMLFLTMPLHNNGTLNFDNGMWVGYTTMVISLSLVFFGVKSYRDSHAAGVITFGKAFKIGMLITLVASVFYALSWEVAYHTISKGFTEKMQQHYTDKIREEAKSEAELNEKLEKSKQNWELYKNPAVRFGMTLMEILPVGLIISLISAGLLRRKEFLPPTETINS